MSDTSRLIAEEKRARETARKSIYQEMDGYYYFWPESKCGCWSEYGLSVVLEELKRMNNEVMKKQSETDTDLFLGVER